MSFEVSATRLSCFALVSAVESDLRALIQDAMSVNGIPDFLTDDMRSIARDRCARDEASDLTPSVNDYSLLVYLDFGDLGQLINKHKAVLPSECGAALINVSEELSKLIPIRNRICHSRPMEFDDFQKLHDFALSQVTRPRLAWPELKHAVSNIASDPKSVLRLQIPDYWSAKSTEILHNLPVPDFEDTGFIGRKNDVLKIKKLLFGAYPVISIIGEGGIGKTSLALRALYDLLDEEGDKRFDAIVWVSLKANVLTVTGIQDLRGAIADTLSLFSSVAEALGGTKSGASTEADLLEEILDYMRQFKILVALDNLETLSGASITGLIEDIPSRSKVLITSRVALGQLEHPYPLEPLSKQDAAQFLRRTAISLNLSDIQTSRQGVIDNWCEKLSFNPLAIKWFVASVATGSSPEELLSQSKPAYQGLLRYCFENLYRSLDSHATLIVRLLHVVGRAISKTELQLLMEEVSGGTDTDRTDYSVLRLVNTSVLRRKIAQDPSQPTFYQLGSFARQFLTHVDKPDRDFVERVRKAVTLLKARAEQSERKQAYYNYEQRSIHATTADERMIAAKLIGALEQSRRHDYEGALKSLDTAQHMVPEFSEVRRFRAMILRYSGDFSGAREEYEIAVEMNPQSTIAVYSLAQYLLSELNDADGAFNTLSLLKECMDPPYRALLALVLQRRGLHSESASIYEELLHFPDSVAPRHRVAIRDQAASTYRRWSEHDSRHRESQLFRVHICRALEILVDGYLENTGECDHRTAARLGEVVRAAMCESVKTGDGELAKVLVNTLFGARHKLPFPIRVGSYLEPFRQLLDRGDGGLGCLDSLRLEGGTQEAGTSFRPEVSGLRSGQIERLNKAGGFGFIVAEDDSEWFFHRKFLKNPDDWDRLIAGCGVSFSVGRNAKGPCAVNVDAG